MKLEKIDSKTLLRWYNAMIRCAHYCPVHCDHLDDIPEEYRTYDFLDEMEEEVLNRMEYYDEVKL